MVEHSTLPIVPEILSNEVSKLQDDTFQRSAVYQLGPGPPREYRLLSAYKYQPSVSEQRQTHEAYTFGTAYFGISGLFTFGSFFEDPTQSSGSHQ